MYDSVSSVPPEGKTISLTSRGIDFDQGFRFKVVDGSVGGRGDLIQSTGPNERYCMPRKGDITNRYKSGFVNLQTLINQTLNLDVLPSVTEVGKDSRDMYRPDVLLKHSHTYLRLREPPYPLYPGPRPPSPSLSKDPSEVATRFRTLLSPLYSLS